MTAQSLDPHILQAWLSGRSFARGVAQPVADFGGFRVDTNTEAETSRWVFAEIGPGLVQLARSITEPRYILKLCGNGDDLRSALPVGWQIDGPNYFMAASGERFEQPAIEGYTIEVGRVGPVVEVRVRTVDGSLAASGYAGETLDAFVYDRIVTSPQYRRKGLGRAVMATLQDARRQPASRELLVATQEGRELYTKLGWQTMSRYWTASVAAA